MQCTDLVPQENVIISSIVDNATVGGNQPNTVAVENTSTVIGTIENNSGTSSNNRS